MLRALPGSLASVIVFLGLSFQVTASAQPGTVVSVAKISDSAGGFPPPLDNSDEIGGAVAHLGDLDGAGPSRAAIAVGAIGDDDGGSDRGAVYVVLVDSLGFTVSTQKISDTAGNFTASFSNADEFGGAVAYLGDLDGAGGSVAALAVGAVGDDDGGLNRGCVYILFLNANGTVSSFQKISDTVGNFTAILNDADELGSSIAYLGDLDRSGPSVAAIAVGAIGDDDGGADRGCTYILFLNANGTVASFQKISDTEGGFTATIDDADELGCSVGSLGDLDGAGPSALALAMGASFDDDGGTDRGALYVAFLDTTGAVLSHTKIGATSGGLGATTLDDSDEFGGAVASLGDLDGSGPAAVMIAVGAVGDDDAATDAGIVYVLGVDNTGAVVSQGKIGMIEGNFWPRVDALDDFGGAVASFPDIDGAAAGKRTLVIGASADDDSGNDRGAIYIVQLDGEDPPLLAVGPPARRSDLLGRARPNPFRPMTTLPFRLGESARVRIQVADLQGRVVRTLVDHDLGPGDHHAAWDGRGDSGHRLPSGTYFVQMSIHDRALIGSRKVILLE